MRVAFFGGTFDPPHCGHLAIAQAAASRLQLDRVLFAPVGAQPHKINGPPPASFSDRVEMVRLAIAGQPRFQLSLIDAARADGQPNYTLQTLRRLKETLQPEDVLFCLLGADSFLTLPKWFRAQELLFACDFIVAGRPGFSLDQFAPGLPPGVHMSHHRQERSDDWVLFTLTRSVPALDHEQQGPHLEESQLGQSQLGQSKLGQSKLGQSRLWVLPDLQEDISATQIRSALASGAQGETVLPFPVVAYIHAHGLYR